MDPVRLATCHEFTDRELSKLEFAPVLIVSHDKVLTEAASDIPPVIDGRDGHAWLLDFVVVENLMLPHRP